MSALCVANVSYNWYESVEENDLIEVKTDLKSYLMKTACHGAGRQWI
jgi:hypothetical protein